MRKLSRNEKTAAAIVTLAIALPLVFAAWRAHLDADPVLIVPKVVLPVPNAYNTFIAAARMHTALVAVAPNANAVDYLTDNKAPLNLDAAQLKLRYPTAAKVAWIKKDAPALALLRQGLTYQCRAPDLPFRDMAMLREIARLIIIESHARAESGDANGAAHSALDCMSFGQALQRGSVFVTATMGEAICGMGRAELGKLLPHLDAGTCVWAAKRVETMEASRTTLAQTLKVERTNLDQQLCDVMRQPGWRSSFYDFAKVRGGPAWQLWLRSRLITKRTVLNDFDAEMGHAIANANKPYGLQRSLSGTDALADWWASVFNDQSLLFNNVRRHADTLLLMTNLALRAIYLQHGRYPDGVVEICPGYLRRVPLDPFGRGEALHCKVTKTGPLLYSVGPDGVDDGGRPVVGRNPSTAAANGVAAFDSKGDIVAGINQ